MGATGGRDGQVKLWDLDISDLNVTLQGHSMKVTCIDITENHAYVVSGSDDKTLCVWTVDEGDLMTTYNVRMTS